MKVIALLTLLAHTGLGMQINYYTDGGCSQFTVSPPNVPADGSCYNYSWSSMNSANIANCNYPSCTCVFYEGSNCQGVMKFASTQASNCASNWGRGFKSFACLGRNA
ncbi:uncharacterized protein CTRU02_214068 [Colletotrichum truncatum]|uniref:Uncharacterized protein n=1 Tax=Colletotrichum truncatum TaxID=5467 RepID=A0ACC3YHJ3_COLTU|nr:uncharacterized protein CTRU02_06380 [Colletotrichum truncatum]KAF6792884.1 hypothetical protein CTRU02_06380 [Colletotrichum truncatum]